jgi:ABC-type amino acid transport substrate-binding protein
MTLDITLNRNQKSTRMTGAHRLKKLALCILVAHVSLYAFAAEGQLEKIRQTREITIAHREASIPFSYFDDQKRPMGYAVDLCLKIASAVERELKLPLKINYLPVTPATRISAISEGKAAMECGSTTNNAERRKQVDYTIAHFVSSSRFLVRVDSGIEKIEDLSAKRVASTKGTTNIKTLERLDSERLLKMKIIEAKDHAEAFSMLERKEVDAFAMDDVLLFGLRANSASPETFKVVGKPMTIEPYAIMLPKGDVEFKKVVDTEMRRIIQSGEIYTLYRKWFEQPIAPKGINLALPMPYLLRDSLKYPSDKVADIVN